MPDLLQVCAVCGSLRLQFEAWVYVNGGRVLDSSHDGECWCSTCQRHDVETVWLRRTEWGWQVDGGCRWPKDVAVTVTRTNYAAQPCRLLWTTEGELRFALSFDVAVLPLRPILRAIRARAKATAAP